MTLRGLSRLLLLPLRALSQKDTITEHTTMPPTAPTTPPTTLPTRDEFTGITSAGGTGCDVGFPPTSSLEITGDEPVEGKEPFVTTRKPNARGVCSGLPVYLAESTWVLISKVGVFKKR